MGTLKKSGRSRFPESVRRIAVERLSQGRSWAEVAREFGVSTTTIYNWKRGFDNAIVAFPSSGLVYDRDAVCALARAVLRAYGESE
jgi:transposase-like protein